jgi:hypothetical protein
MGELSLTVETGLAATEPLAEQSRPSDASLALATIGTQEAYWATNMAKPRGWKTERRALQTGPSARILPSTAIVTTTE